MATAKQVEVAERFVVTVSGHSWIEDLPVEMVERKGIGHPDSLCDGMAERISADYTRWCLQHVGMPLHHNFDKVQLVAGSVSLSFGNGELLKPMRIQIAGRGTTATPDGRPIPLDLLAIQAAKAYLRETMRHLDPDRHCVVDCYAGAGAEELVETVARVTANDTSIGVAHWPLSRLEQTVMESARALNGPLLNEYPIGEDVKVMGVRQANRFSLTCAVPFLARCIASLQEYREAKEALGATVAKWASGVAGTPVTVGLNMADSPQKGSVYLSLTGTSAECGDDGAVGRGNRVTGLITPFRATSLEAAAGKNPVSHVGKLYNLVALQAARAIVAAWPVVRQAEVALVSQIGRPLDEPVAAHVSVHMAGEKLSEGLAAGMREVLQAHLVDLDAIRSQLLTGTLPVF